MLLSVAKVWTQMATHCLSKPHLSVRQETTSSLTTLIRFPSLIHNFTAVNVEGAIIMIGFLSSHAPSGGDAKVLTSLPRPKGVQERHLSNIILHMEQ